jgi:Type IV secretion-system coupling protein DNA-binding domain
MLVSISVPAGSTRGPLYMDQAPAAIHQGNSARLPISLVLGEHHGAIGLFCRFPPELRAIVEDQLYAQYPDCRLLRLPDDALNEPAAGWTADLHLRGDLFPIRNYPEFDDRLNRVTADPIGALLSTLASEKRGQLRARIEIDVRPAAPRRLAYAERLLRRLDTPFFAVHPKVAAFYADLALSGSRWRRLFTHFFGSLAAQRGSQTNGSQVAKATHTARLESAAAKLHRHLFEIRIRIIVSGDSRSQAAQKLSAMAGAFGQFSVPGSAEFHIGRLRFAKDMNDRKLRHGFLLSSEELATIWHPATTTVRSPQMETVASRELEPPVVLPSHANEPDLAVLGRVRFRARRELVGIRSDDRRRHLAVIGKTGMGKSALLQNLLLSDMRAGRGMALIDPHGDLAEAVLACVPSYRTNDVLLFDAGDQQFPIGFNLLACKRPEDRPLVASGIVSAFQKLWGDSWGPRLEYILRNSILTLLEIPGTSLLAVTRLLTDTAYRNLLVGRIADPLVKNFWHNEFNRWKPQLQTEATAPVLNKVGAYLSSPILRAIVGQSVNAIDLRRIMDEGRILIVNLSKGRMGEDASALLGSLFVTGMQLAAMGRAEVAEEHRRDFYLAVDEFQNFATQSFATILSEARKYRLNLTIANQYLDQMDEQTAAAVFGNVGSLLAFQVGSNDAEVLAQQLGGDLQPQDLIALPKHTAYLRLLVDGQPSRAFSVETLPPPRQLHDVLRAEIIRRLSHQRYASRSADVRWAIESSFLTTA